MADSGALITNGTATGPTSSMPRMAGDYCFAVDGTFSGATVALQMLSLDRTANWLTIADTGLTAEGAMIVTLPSGRYRASVASGPPVWHLRRRSEGRLAVTIARPMVEESPARWPAPYLRAGCQPPQFASVITQ